MVEIDFAVPQTSDGVYVVDAQIFDSNNYPLDDAQAPFSVSSSAPSSYPSNPSTPTYNPGAAPANSTQGVSTSGGQFSYTVTPGGGPVGTSVAITLNYVDQGTAQLALGLYDQNNNLVPVQATQNANNPNEIDIVIPQTPDGSYQLVLEEQDSSGNPMDDALAPFTVATNGAAPAAPSAPAPSAPATPPAPSGPTYSNDIAPILQNCTGCHNGSRQVSLQSYSDVVSECVPGDPSNSRLVQKVNGNMGGYLNSQSDAQTIAAWVAAGCPQ
jgi:hypothetical protein